jgi:hypothetical protein
MLKDDFQDRDSIEERIKKLAKLTGLKLEIRQWNPSGSGARLKVALAGDITTEPMATSDLLKWSAAFALGYRARAMENRQPRPEVTR